MVENGSRCTRRRNHPASANDGCHCNIEHICAAARPDLPSAPVVLFLPQNDTLDRGGMSGMPGLSRDDCHCTVPVPLSSQLVLRHSPIPRVIMTRTVVHCLSVYN
jgi:hypothetical protein